MVTAEEEDDYRDVATHEEFMRLITERLRDWRFDERPYEASGVAAEFLRYCCERAWVFT